ncbi:30S ribosomal protein S3Ae, partial [mine drainage metagenome]
REKTWYSILTPAYLGEKKISTSPGIGPESMVGRKIEMPVSDLTGNFKKTTLKMVFRIDNCQGNRCFTSFVGSYVSDDSIRRMVRRRKERIDVIEKDHTLDGYLLAVKVVGVSDVKLITNKRADIRLALEKFLKEKISTSNLQDLVSYLVG